jgi:hypothetical protein
MDDDRQSTYFLWKNTKLQNKRVTKTIGEITNAEAQLITIEEIQEECEVK